MRVAYWDLETTRLEGQMGQLLCGSILCHDGEMVTFRQDECYAGGRRKSKVKSMADDSELAELIRDKLEEHHISVAYYGKGFDVPFLNTRLAYHGLRRLTPHLHLDPRWYFSGWRGLKTQNAKLKTVAEFFDLEQKPDVPRQMWLDAAGGDTEAMDVLADRCEADVRILKAVTEKALDTRVVKNIQTYP